MVERHEDARFLDTLWFDVPSREIVLQHANKSFFGFWAILRAGCTRMAMTEAESEDIVGGNGAKGRSRRHANETERKRVLGHSGNDMRNTLTQR